MKRQKLHIRLAWLILISFVAGQTMVYSHQHHINYRAISIHAQKAPQPAQTVTEKCNVCDMMHHNQMAIFSNARINPPVTICNTYYNRQHDYQFIGLVLAAGRAPPVLA